MHSYHTRFLLLALTLTPALCNAGTRLGAGECLSWGSNTTTTVFHGCCQNVTLERLPTLAITALCPNRLSDYDASLFPEGLYTFSRLRLDSFLFYYKGELVMGGDVGTTDEIPALQNVNAACDDSTFDLDLDSPTVSGTCGGINVSYTLDFLLLSHRGLLTVPPSLGIPSAPLNTSCCNITLSNSTSSLSSDDSPSSSTSTILTAICQTSRVTLADCSNTTGARQWRTTSIDLGVCQAKWLDLNPKDESQAILQGSQEGCATTVQKGKRDGTLATGCGSHVSEWPYDEVVRNQYGRLSCWDFLGT